MAEVETRLFISGSHLDGGEAKHDCASSARETRPLTQPGCSRRRSRQKILIVGNKRPVIYRRYRSSKTERQRRDHVYRCVPSAETTATRFDVSTGPVNSSEPAASGKSSKVISETDGTMCGIYDNECVDQMKPEWKLVAELLAVMHGM